jgi:hypothetical protein
MPGDRLTDLAHPLDISMNRIAMRLEPAVETVPLLQVVQAVT